jgi:hypothetical protein
MVKMEYKEALSEIKSFWAEPDFPFPTGGGEKTVLRLQTEFGMELPKDLRIYIRDIAPSNDYIFETVGNPMTVYGFAGLSRTQPGYNYNPVENKPIEEWDNNWFIFADEGADPVIIDLSKNKCTVLQAMHGTGDWDFTPVADSIGQFLLCSAALHFALSNWGRLDAIEDEGDFNLAKKPAEWLFPKMKVWAGSYYEDWCSVFDNS